ncbi:MAG: amino acid permease [Bryobacterales bacterium]|nr:amino acid permease [Bryobacterales bacterium]
MPPSTKPALVRSIRKWDLVAVAINSVIGAGIFGLPSKVYELAGAYSLPAFLLCGLFAGMIVLCFAEVGSRYSETGGPYLYARDAFGPAVGFTMGWLMWIARVTAFAANTSILLGYLSLFWPALAGGPVRAAAICAITLAVAGVNVIGVRDVTLTTNILTVAKMTPLVLLIVVGCFFVEPANFTFGAVPATSNFSSAMMLLVYAYTGFEMAFIPGGEMRDPKKDLPGAVFTAIGMVVVIYVLIQVVCIGTLPELAASNRPLADAASRFLGSWGAGIISLGAALSIAGNLNIVVLSASRLPFAMAVRGELPSFLGTVHKRFHTPYISIVLTAAIMAAVTLSGTFLYAVTVSTIARLFIYATTCGALPVLRRRQSAAPAGFRAPLGTIVTLAVLGLVVWLVMNTTWHEVRDTAIAAAAGLMMYALCRRQSRRVLVKT